MKEPAGWAFALAIGMGLMVGAVWLRRPAPSQIQDSDPLLRVALIDMDRADHVRGLLAARDIPVGTWGGGKTGYWVEVPESQAYRAVTVLRKDAKELQYTIHFGDQHPHAVQEKQWMEPWVETPYADLLSRPPYASTTDVGACLRRPEVASVAKTYSKISRIRYSRRNLFETARKNAVIEELWLEKFPEPNGGKRRISGFQLFDGGREVHCIMDRESSKE